MFFKLINTSIVFQTYINNILKEHLDIFVIVYLNNKLVYSKNEMNYKVHVRKILRAL